MKVYEHQVQRSHKFCRVFEWLYMTRRYFFHRANYGHFRQLRLVSIWRTLNQTRRCSAVRSHLFELINDNLFELARDRERERERERGIACVNLRLRVFSTSNEAYFKNCDFTPSLQRNITLRVTSLSKLFY